jgi:hypothetical protein
VIAQVPGCLGSYAFVWGWKFEATATWFGLLTNEGLATPSVDVLQEKWSGKAPANRAPEIEPMRGVPKEAVKPGGSFTAEVVARDPEGDALVWEWSVFKEKTTHNAAERLKMPATLKGAVISTSKNQAVIQAPTKSGVYRLHVWVKDGQGHAATANLPFEVEKIVSP